MKVFKITPTEPYTAGAAYVAAKNKEEAINTFCKEGYGDYKYKYGKCTCNHVVNMSYDIDKPFVIFDDLYLE